MNRPKFGRAPRARHPHVPHMSALFAGKKLPAPPPSVDWSAKLPANLGMMLNDELGDCTCAAVYHALQVWLANTTGAVDVEPDSNVLDLYEEACGYNPAKGGEGPGGVEQDVLTFWMNKGVIMGKAPDQTRNHLTAFVEVDPRDHDDVMRSIDGCGLVYIGFDVPAYLMEPVNGQPPDQWQLPAPGEDTSIVGGHAVILVGYDSVNLKVVSWGRLYTMSWNFFDRYVDEVYAPIDASWVANTGKTPGGLTLEDLQAQMKLLQET